MCSGCAPPDFASRESAAQTTGGWSLGSDSITACCGRRSGRAPAASARLRGRRSARRSRPARGRIRRRTAASTGIRTAAGSGRVSAAATSHRGDRQPRRRAGCRGAPRAGWPVYPLRPGAWGSRPAFPSGRAAVAVKMLLRARPAPIPARSTAMARNPSAGCPATAARPKEISGEQRHRDHGERDVLAGEVGAQRAAAGQRHRLQDEAPVRLIPTELAWKTADERRPEGRAGQQSRPDIVGVRMVLTDTATMMTAVMPQ